jgi:spore maturation protein CgeB
MRFLRVSTASSDYVHNFYAARPGLENCPHSEQTAAFFRDHFAWGDSRNLLLAKLGYTYLGVDSAAAPLLAQWGAENMATDRNLSPLNLVVEQARRFAPEVMMFNSPDAALLAAIKAVCPSLRLSFGWVGSALGLKELWREMDLILSCAPESVEELRRRGARAEHLDHGFDPQLNDHPPRTGPKLDLSFVGTIVRRGQ